jgi:cell division protein FtsL
VAVTAPSAPRAEAAPRPRPQARPQPRAAPRRRASARSGILGGVLWIVALATLLAGVVALNVAVLQLNVRSDRLSRERTELRDANASLQAELSSAAANPRLEALARGRLGLVPAEPERTTYVVLEP